MISDKAPFFPRRKGDRSWSLLPVRKGCGSFSLSLSLLGSLQAKLGVLGMFQRAQEVEGFA